MSDFKMTRDEFLKKLKEASEEVKKWPEWEQNILGQTKVLKWKKN